MSSSYRIAIIGVGAIGTLHARAIRDIPNAILVGGSHLNEQAARGFGEKFQTAWYTDFEKMLYEQKPDIATICTPSGAHRDTALAVLKRGIHVLSEKPLEINCGRIDEMIAAATAAGVVLGGIFPQRYNPVIMQLHTAARAGRFGNLAVVNSYVPWWRDDAYYGPGRWQGTLAMDGGGAMMNQSIHGVDLVQWLAAATMPQLEPNQNPVQEVFAFTAQRGHDPKLIEVEDTAVAVLRFRDGSLGQLLGATSMYPGSLKRIQIAGRDGTAEVLEEQLVTWQFRTPSPEDEQTRARFGGATKIGGGAADPLTIDYGLHTRNIIAFLESLDRGCAPDIDAVQARKAVAIIEAIYASARSGKAVAVA
jgi:UDP-N-acetyl-2-amino-2-deoxyglucuronate dehydrogenase